MQVLVVEFLIHPAWVEPFRAAITENARASRQTEAGCRQFDVCIDPANPELFFLYELYDDDAAVQAHLRSEHYLQMNALTAAWVKDKRVWRYERVAPALSDSCEPVGSG